MWKQGCLLGLVFGCAGEVAVGLDASKGEDALVVDAAMLDPTPGTYRQTCDGSGALALGFEYFIDVNDENQSARMFRRAADGGPVQSVELGAGLDLSADDEADLEGLARIADRIYAITSHARKSSGDLDRARYRFGALDVSGSPPSLGATPAGVTTQLLDQMLVAANWDAPNPAVIAALDASSQLDTDSDEDLAPEVAGTNVEGLASNGSTSLLIGFRNPRPGNRAIVISLTNPDAVIAGQTARFGGAAELDLGGLGIRALEWSEVHRAVLIVAGPHRGDGPFRLYKWSGALDAQPTLVADLSVPPMGSPESVVAYPGTLDVQIVYDMGDADVNGTPCKDAPIADQLFRDAIIHVD